MRIGYSDELTDDYDNIVFSGNSRFDSVGASRVPDYLWRLGGRLIGSCMVSTYFP